MFQAWRLSYSAPHHAAGGADRHGELGRRTAHDRGTWHTVGEIVGDDDNTGSVASHRAALTDRRWQSLGAEERFDGQFSEDRHTLRGQWERLVDGRWAAWMTTSLTQG